MACSQHITPSFHNMVIRHYTKVSFESHTTLLLHFCCLSIYCHLLGCLWFFSKLLLHVLLLFKGLVMQRHSFIALHRSLATCLLVPFYFCPHLLHSQLRTFRPLLIHPMDEGASLGLILHGIVQISSYNNINNLNKADASYYHLRAAKETSPYILSIPAHLLPWSLIMVTPHLWRGSYALPIWEIEDCIRDKCILRLCNIASRSQINL